MLLELNKCLSTGNEPVHVFYVEMASDGFLSTFSQYIHNLKAYAAVEKWVILKGGFAA